MTKYQKHHYLQALGIPIWVCRVPSRTEDSTHETTSSAVVPNQQTTHDPLTTDTPVTEVPTRTAVIPPPAANAALADLSQMDWQALQTQVAACQQCSLHISRSQTVFGSDTTAATCMVIGDTPSSAEDRQGHPLAGAAGQLLSNMLLAIDLSVKSVYITHITKCRSPNDRPPLSSELAQCQGYLYRQIELLKPAAILILGRVSAQHLLQCKTPLPALRGHIHAVSTDKIPAIVTYHPRNLLKQALDKRKTWEDLKLFKNTLEKTCKGASN